MRRFKFFLLPAVSVLIVACLFLFNPLNRGGAPALPDSSDALKQMTGHFDATATISYKGIGATATISQLTPEACTVTFTEPASLKDMSFVFSRDSVDVSYKGMSFAFDPASMPNGAMAKLAVNALNRAVQQEGLMVEQTPEGVAVSGSIDQGAFTLLLDPDSGLPVKLLIPAQELEIDFSSFQFLG